METFLYMLPLIIVFVGFYFLAIRPLQKKYGSEEWEQGKRKRKDDYWDDRHKKHDYDWGTGEFIYPGGKSYRKKH